MMMKKGLIILSLLFVLAIALLPFALSSCGMNGFHMNIGNATTACGSAQNLGHLTFMRGFLTFGLVASVVVLTAILFFYLIFSLISRFEPVQLGRMALSALRQKFISSCFKPFDQLALAYAHGLVQPKVFFQPS